MKDYRRLFTLTVGVLLVLYAGAGAFFLPYASFYGDLTRMGMVPEKDFSWHKEQPLIPGEWQVASKLAEADVLVVGDSFSAAWVWQSELVRHGLKVHTLQWGEVRGICEDFSGWLHAHGFKGKYVVIESVEWKLQTVLQSSLTCTRTPGDVPDHAGKLGSTLRYLEEGTPLVQGKMSVGLRTAWNGWRYSLAQSEATFKSKNFAPVTIRRLADGCQLFSNRRCEDGLFLDYEMENEGPDAGAIEQMKQIAGRLQGYKVMWLVVPNKSTAYLNRKKTFWRTAGQQLDVPDVLAIFDDLLSQKKIVDLYKPNDTHLSTAGYQELGRIAWRALMKAGVTGSDGKNPPAPAASKS